MAKRTAKGKAMGVKLATLLEIRIKVRRQERDGWFVYTCDQLLGLYVASQDDKRAYHDVPTAIRKLVKLTFGIDCIVVRKEARKSFEDLALSQRASQAVADHTHELLAAGKRDFSLVVQCVHPGAAHA